MIRKILCWLGIHKRDLCVKWAYKITNRSKDIDLKNIVIIDYFSHFALEPCNEKDEGAFKICKYCEGAFKICKYCEGAFRNE